MPSRSAIVSALSTLYTDCIGLQLTEPLYDILTLNALIGYFTQHM